jgi:spermidine/putrescine transport system substrate-binding protein
MRTRRQAIATILSTAIIGLTAASQATAQSGKPVLNLFCWSEYVPEAVVKGFEKETGIKVNVENYDSNEKMLAKLLAGGAKYDLIQPSEYVIESLIKQGQLEPIDTTKIENFKNLDPKSLNLPHDPGNKFTVPWMLGTVGIVVNTTKIKDEVKGYADVFSGKYKKRIVVLDDNREIVTWALATEGLPINDITPEALAKVKPIVKGWLKQVKAYDSDSPKTKFLKGDVDIGIVWSGEAAILWDKAKGSGKFKYILPAEGAHQFVDSLCVPKGAPHKDAALQFINYILKPEVSKLISEDFPYTNPNLEARKLLKKEQQENPASYPTGEPKLETFKDIGKAARDIDKMMTDLRSQ